MRIRDTLGEGGVRKTMRSCSNANARIMRWEAGAEHVDPAGRMSAVSDRTNRCPSVREVLATRTREVHERLHTHPWISRLASASLTSGQYRAVLEAYHAFSVHVESARSELGVLRPLSLAPAIDALESDVAALRGDTDRRLRPRGLRLDDRPAVLGALYVLHGSGFGNRVLSRSVRDSLPEAPRDYLETGVPRGLWVRLEAELERLRDDDVALERLEGGAASTFDAFGRFVSWHCEAGLVSRSRYAQGRAERDTIVVPPTSPARGTRGTS